MEVKKVIFVVGAAGSAKTATEMYMVNNFKHVQSAVSMTTREKRPGEIEGTHYYFKNVEDFLKTERLNTIEMSKTWYYGMPVSEIKKQAEVLVYSLINLAPGIETMNSIKKINPDIEFGFVFLNISEEKRVANLVKNGTSLEDAKSRVKRQFKVETLKDFEEAGASINLEINDFSENMQEMIANKIL